MATFNSAQIDFNGFAISDVVQIWQSDDTDILLSVAAGYMLQIWQITANPPVTDLYSYLPVQSGYLMPAERPSPRLTMRAYKTTPTTGYVYWDVDEPDLTGQFSGHPPASLTDIVIYHECCTPNDDATEV